ncbi:hypothetical protein OUY22_36090 [Nonomuraea sp. MCN248]|uniref:SWIM-type domain-containing protein n=1 Tax=Nonomuraea corallina TaxID=2989783 RepID=A0ABT4SNN2_9ACTN|nr:hypothetical protein [Nonomuraea corallina]MDA0638863.1 hypothetical protein [Nonomuraea corallina]
MSFRASKLRVQLPCTAEGSLIDLADEEAPQLAREGTYLCTCYLTNLDYCHCSVVLTREQAYLVSPDALPLLKKQLEHRLAEVDLAAEAAKKQLREHLDDIAEAERALTDRSAREQGGGE